MKQHQTITGRRAAMRVAALMLMLFTLLPAMAAAPKANPRLESLHIDIWPEYDRPAALVILRGQLGKDVALPAAVSLRIPASSGGPSAVAYANPERAELFNLDYKKADAKESITVAFSVPDRVFHLEFYDAFPTGDSERNYRYVWPGDLPVDKLSVLIQEPAASSDFSVQPPMPLEGTGPDGLRYRSAELGAFPSGKAFPVEIRYTKADPRTSAELLKPDQPAAAPSSTGAPGGNQLQLLLVLGVFVPLLLVAVIGFVWWRQRPRPATDSAGSKAFCTKCGNRIAPGDRFCAKCGAALK
jgi:hypothetical protein